MADFDDVDTKLEAWAASADPAERTAAAIWADVTDRRGWRQASYEIDDDIGQGILDVWAALIRANAEGAS